MIGKSELLFPSSSLNDFPILLENSIQRCTNCHEFCKFSLRIESIEMIDKMRIKCWNCLSEISIINQKITGEKRPGKESSTSSQSRSNPNINNNYHNENQKNQKKFEYQIYQPILTTFL